MSLPNTPVPHIFSPSFRADIEDEVDFRTDDLEELHKTPPPRLDASEEAPATVHAERSIPSGANHATTNELPDQPIKKPVTTYSTRAKVYWAPVKPMTIGREPPPSLSLSAAQPFNPSISPQLLQIYKAVNTRELEPLPILTGAKNYVHWSRALRIWMHTHDLWEMINGS